LQSGDIVFAGSGETPEEIGRATAYCDSSKAYAGGDTIIFRPGPGLVSRFVGYAVNSVAANRYKSKMGQGSSVFHISSEHLSRLPLRFPSLPEEQHCVADVLQTVDEAIEQTEALIAKTQQIKAGLMHDLFTRGVTPNGQLRPAREEAPKLYKESPLGWIPKEWEVDVFGNRISIVDPNPSHRYPGEQETGVPICSTENFRGDDGFDLSRSKLMPPQVLLEQQQRCRFASNDVVFARKGRIGLARRYGDTPKVFSHTVVLFKARTATVDQNWLLWLARSRWFLDDIDRRMNSNSGVPTLGVAFINAVTVPFPQADEQQVINRHLDEVAGRESTEDAELTKLRSLKAGLMHDLLTGRVRVPVAELREVVV